ncbi:MAG: S-ribosylhomocysteine lyase [Christensenellales bacterium]|jgi:S-ribosylhomocysteine lyase
MKKIASFTVDHTKLVPGMYVSRVDGDITTYDLRMVRPNTPPYLENAALHTFEHLFATYARNTAHADNIIYIGPMGCRTGFYFLTRDLPASAALELVRESCAFIRDYAGEIPGASAAECGNWEEHSLPGAKTCAEAFFRALAGWTPERMAY